MHSIIKPKHPCHSTGRQTNLFNLRFWLLVILASFGISCSNYQGADAVEVIGLDAKSKQKTDTRLKETAVGIQQAQWIGFASVVGLMALGLAITYRDYRKWRTAARELGRRVEERTEELRHLSERLNKELADKESFAEKRSREIRESTQGILGLCLVAKHDFKDEKKIGDFLQMVERNADRVILSVQQNRRKQPSLD